MHFPLAQGRGLRHPSQLYEAFFEGIFLFVILWTIRKKKLPQGSLLGLYLIGYGVVRFFIEFFRGDQDRGWVAQLISLAGVVGGLILYVLLRKSNLSKRKE